MTDIEQANLVINKAQMTERLLLNEDFKEVIIKGFIEDYLLAQVNYALLKDEQRNNVNERIVARGILYKYINDTIGEGVSAKEYLDSLENQEGVDNE